MRTPAPLLPGLPAPRRDRAGDSARASLGVTQEGRNVEQPYSDRVYTTLLWEFMQFAKGRVWDSAFLESSLGMLQKTSQVDAEAARQLLARNDVLKLVPLCASQLFLDFVMANPNVLTGPDDLIEWVKSKQDNYPIP